MSTAFDSLRDWFGRAMIVDIVGDAEAYVFDWTALPADKRDSLTANHFAALDARLKAAGKADWTERFRPFALLGESMPPAVRQRFDLSAPHEGTLFLHVESGGVTYCAAKDDERMALALPELEMLSLRESFVHDVVDPIGVDYAYDVDRGESDGFTLSQIELVMQMAGVGEIKFL